MAIRVENIVARPPYPEKHPLAPVEISPESAKLVMRERVKRYAEGIPQGFVSRARGPRRSLTLISIDREGGWMNSTEAGHPGYVLDGVQLQDLTIEAMQEFGLNTNITYESEHSLNPHPNGTIRERTVYPSQTVKGLSFERWFDSVEATGEPVSVDWRLLDTHVNPGEVLIGMTPPKEVVAVQPSN